MKVSEFDALYHKEFERAKRYFGDIVHPDAYYVKSSLVNRCGAQHVGYDIVHPDVIEFYFDREPEGGGEYEEDEEFKLHRLDGPAYISNRQIEWYVKDRLHRTDGPAVVKRGKEDQFWVNGKKMAQEEFEKHFDIKESKFGKLVEAHRYIYDYFVTIYQREAKRAKEIMKRGKKMKQSERMYKYPSDYSGYILSPSDKKKCGNVYLITDGSYHFEFFEETRGTVPQDNFHEFLYNKLHRLDGPAVINGSYVLWYQHANMHRTDGPAEVSHKKEPQYWINNKKMTKEEYQEHFEDEDSFDG